MLNKKTLAQAQNAKRKKGFTLTEIAIVLGIMGLILGAIWTAASGVYNNQRVAHGNTTLLQIAQGVRSLYASQALIAPAGADITATLTSAGATPSDLGTNDPLDGPFPNGKTMVISSKDGVGFFIAMSGLSQSACINMLTSAAGNTRDPGLFNADAVASTLPSTADGGSTNAGVALTTPVTPAIAGGATTGTALSSGQGGCTGSTTYKVRFGFSLK